MSELGGFEEPRRLPWRRETGIPAALGRWERRGRLRHVVLDRTLPPREAEYAEAEGEGAGVAVSPAVRAALDMLLRVCGWQTRCCGSAQEFLQVFDASQTGCLVLDLQMNLEVGDRPGYARHHLGADQADGNAFDGEIFVGIDFDRREIGVFGEQDHAPLLA